MSARLQDYLGNNIVVSSMIAYGASRGVRFGQVLAINESVGDYDTIYSITMVEALPDNKTRRKTFPFEPHRVVVVG